MAAPEKHSAAAGDLRRFLKELHDEGDLLIIRKEVDPEMELAAITRRVYETEEKAPLFENIKGRHGDGLFRVLGAPVGLSRVPGQRLGRIAKSLGLPSTAAGAEIIDKINSAKSLQPLDPVEVQDGPVKEFKLFGDDIDLTSLPTPLLHQHDGGKFLETFGMHIVQTPDGSWTNWSITRAMTHDKRHLVGPIIPKQDIGVIYQMWKDKGEDMPWALCFGVPPAAIMVGGMPIPKGVDEAGFIGALIGKPVDVVKCETNNIRVPVNAEIVFEGTVSITETAPEGPMMEYHGHVWPEKSKLCPLFKVNAITYRADPILPICITGRATEESHTCWAVMIAAEVLTICQDAGLPIQMVWCPFESHAIWYVIQVDRAKLRKLTTNMEDFCTKLGHVVFGSKPGWYMGKVFLVGEDVDPTSLRDVIWAESTRCEPGTCEFLFDEYGNIPLIPYVGYGVKPAKNHKKVVKCCMLPCEFEDIDLPWKVGSFRGSYPVDVQKTVEENWERYGFQPLLN
ncbi:UbiD decarboxylyase family [Aspergillus karnatakaensis]|uniref:UbiD family decarboxylase n=1 Tax=Aspergillus karnatakaensis TaxID=1810916 RepID=UPI003CCE424D